MTGVRFWRCVCWIALIYLIGHQPLFASPGSLDTNFNPVLHPGADIYTIALQTNGQILIAGSFTNVGNLPRFNVARLNADGTADPNFDPGMAADNGYVNSIAVQPDGKIVIGGFFFSTLFQTPNYLARLNADGSVDEDFAPGLFINAWVRSVLIQSDGKILFGGSFTTVNQQPRRSVARLYADGTLDMDFDACAAADDGGGTRALILQPDARILAGGNFEFSTGYVRNGIARLGICGDIDPGYALEPGVNEGALVAAVALRPNGRVVIGGDFDSYHNASLRGIAQLTAQGTIDPSFDPGTGIDPGATIFAIALQPDGKAVIGGSFSSYKGHLISKIARVNTDGTLDLDFDPGTGPDDIIGALAVQPDGNILVGGRFSTFNGESRMGLARLIGDPPRPLLSAPTLLSEGGVELTLFGQAGRTYTLQSSSNFLNWITVTNFTALDPETILTDHESYSARFYRAFY